ncbi:Na+/H+ antiporter subunit A [Naasia sp. SYSU D00948]|uniref:Na+/H+ antiporter subunit A n=1 Tax=Naasia sp. SYSU D00948 TaxID=2817379 RepID=UPI001B30828C|nr:Na+/H+ antiporter subunit A [Naasia sp. SYSU D00948]
MLVVLGAFGIASVLVPALTPRLGTRVFLLAAVPAVAAVVHAALAAPAVFARGVSERVPWVPALGLTLDTRLDPLSWVLALLVGGVGALVLVYCRSYFRNDEPHLGAFAGSLTAFAGSMYGLVVADDVYLLFVFWELTTVFSYLLIGHYSSRRASRGSALQALLVTTFGGLTMLAGFVLLTTAAGTSRLSELATRAPEGAVGTVGAVLIVVGILSKSAVVPLHFWLPGAMAAPTPVSAYLHAAAMVKAGIYLAARFSPAFAETPGWRESLVLLGLVTMLVGGWRALRETDLKLVLAYGTVAQLGFLTAAIGFGTRDALLGGLALLVAHALFKSTLFLVVGIVDHDTGTRDLRKLSGLGRAAPALAVVAALAAASMAGLPPFAGFVGKETVLAAMVHAGESGDVLGWIALAGSTAGSALTAAYAARVYWGAFARKPGVPDVGVIRESPAFLLAPAVLAVLGLAGGIAAPGLDAVLAPVADVLPAEGEVEHLALWHGIGIPLLLSAVTIGLGLGAFLLREPIARVQARLALRRSASDAYRGTLSGIDRVAARTTKVVQRGSLPYYLAVILVVFVVAVVSALVRLAPPLPEARLWDQPMQPVAAVVMSVAAIAATVAAKRFQAVVLVGVTGFGMALLFADFGAPDLALTQALVELVTLVAFVLVLRRLPARLGTKHGSSFRLGRAALGIAVGAIMSVVALVALAARTATPIAVEFPRLAVDGGHGVNVVNVTLVDIRGWDTMGELSVIIAAATGVASLVFLSSRSDRMPEFARRSGLSLLRGRSGRPSADHDDRGSWLLAGRTLAPRNRSILLEVVVRLVFPALIVLSLYLLLAGHNAPGGGFAGGLVAGLALVARYLAAGRIELAAAAPVSAGALLGSGLLFATGAAVVPLFLGVDALTSTYLDLDLGWFGSVSLVTSTIFDVGVYLVVIGLVLDVLRSLGAEVDRQEEEGDEPSLAGRLEAEEQRRWTAGAGARR